MPAPLMMQDYAQWSAESLGRALPRGSLQLFHEIQQQRHLSGLFRIVQHRSVNNFIAHQYWNASDDTAVKKLSPHGADQTNLHSEWRLQLHGYPLPP
jgi:hypothetical protein